MKVEDRVKFPYRTYADDTIFEAGTEGTIKRILSNSKLSVLLDGRVKPVTVHIAFVDVIPNPRISNE